MTDDTEGRFTGYNKSRIRSVTLTPEPGRVRIDWPPVDGAPAYDIFRSDALAGPWALWKSVAAGESHVIDEPLAPNTRVAYRVAVSGDGLDRASIAQMVAVPAPRGANVCQYLNDLTSDEDAFARATSLVEPGGTLTIPYRPAGYRLGSLRWRDDIVYAGMPDQPRSIVYFTDREQPIPPKNLRVSNVVFVCAPGVFVSPVGSDANPGTRVAPLRTIQAGVRRAGGAWETVQVDPGTYRESVQIYDNQPGPAPHLPVSIVASVNGTAVIDGGIVLTNGMPDPQNQGVFTYPWPYDFFLDGSNPPVRFRKEFGEKGHAEQFLFNDRPLRQVFSKADLLPFDRWPALSSTLAGPIGAREIFAGRFYVDWDADVVHVRLRDDVSPDAGRLEGATLRRGLGTWGKGVNVFIQGLRLRNFATFPQSSQAALQTGDDWTLVDVTIEHCSNSALGIRGDRNHVLRPVVRFAGQLGIGTSLRSKSVVSDTIIQDGMFERFNYKLHDGQSNGVEGTGQEYGTKFAKCDRFILRGCTFTDCYAHAVWFDIENKNVLIENNIIRRVCHPTVAERGCGIFIEISPGPCIVRGNTIEACSSAGVRVAESRRVTVTGNTIRSCRFCVMLRNITLRPYTLGQITIGTDPSTGQLSPNRLSEWTETALFTEGTKGYFAGITPQSIALTINGNVFAPGPSTKLLIWAGKPYRTLQELRDTFDFEADGF